MRRIALVVLLCFGVLLTSTQSPGQHGEARAADITPIAARAADSLVDSYGIGIHLPFLDTPYKDATAVADALSDLGVRHVRDDLYMNNPRQYAGIKTVADRGIKFNLIMGRPTSPESAADYVTTVADVLPPGSVESIEGTNEWDLSGRPDWVVEMQQRQQELYTAAKANPKTASLPVLAPALAYRWNYVAAGDLSQYADEANGHMYPGGYQPSNEVTRITTAIRGSIATKPLVVTEAGYHNAMNTTNGHLPVPEDVAAVYTPRVLLEHYLRGAKRVYTYELIDEFDDPGLTNPEAHFGLLRRDLTPKPAFTAMKTMLGLVNDPGAPFAPGSLPIKVDGFGGDMRYALMQKRTGQFVLFMWREVAVYDPVSQQRLDVTPSPVTVRFASPKRVTTYRPSTGSAPVGSVVADSLPLALDGQVTALTIDTPTTPAPASVTATPGDASAKVAWTAPAEQQTDITGYEVTRQPGGITTTTTPETRSLSATGLSNGTSYTFSVRTLSSYGTPSSAVSASVVPATVPTASRPYATSPQKRTVAVSWVAADGRGRPVTAYEVRVGGQTKVVSASTTRLVLSGFASGKTLNVTLRARNAIGWSSLSATTVRVR